MLKKKTTAESNYDDETDEEGSESSVQRADDVKRAKLDLESNTTLQDLPLELLECILVKAVVMEVRNMKLAKSAWKEKAELVISRLGPVCSQWSSTLTTNSFRTKLHRMIDSTAQMIRLEIAQQFSMSSQNHAITTLNDEVFLLYKQRDTHYVIKVYARDNMTEVKEVIPLPGTDPRHMTGCNVSNCVYISLKQGDYDDHEVLRISRDAEHKFNISSWKHDNRLSIYEMSVSDNGNVIILSPCESGCYVIGVYNANGMLQHEVDLPPYTKLCMDIDVIQKSNGNLVLAYIDNDNFQLKLLEFDTSGSVVRQFQASCEPNYPGECCVNFADSNDGMMVASSFEVIQLLDSEFNLLGVYSLQPNQNMVPSTIQSHYYRNRNEIMCINSNQSTYKNVSAVLTIFRFTEK